MNILIVDDEKDLLSELRDYFIDRGYHVTTAGNGKEAWSVCCAADKEFDIILTDHRMPIMNGIELVQKLRNNFMNLPVVMMSGDGEASRDSYIGREIIELLPKPTRITKLDEVFTKLETGVFADKNFHPFAKDSTPTTARVSATGATPAASAVAAETTFVESTVVESAAAENDVSDTVAVNTLDVATPRILVVDDEPELLELMCEMLATEDYQTVKADDGMAALDLWQKMLLSGENVDMMLIDLRMPRMDGLALLEAIRNIDPFMPIIVLTGHADFQDAFALLKTFDIADFLPKPLESTSRLIFSVNRALQYAKIARELHYLKNIHI